MLFQGYVRSRIGKRNAVAGLKDIKLQKKTFDIYSCRILRTRKRTLVKTKWFPIECTVALKNGGK